MLLLPRISAAACLLLSLLQCCIAHSEVPSLLDISIHELGELLNAGRVSSRELVDLYLKRIDEVNDVLHAVIETNPDALQIAAQLDEERASGHSRGPLHGIPILVKDNYATTDQTSTGAGSVCLARSRPRHEATVVTRLRRAGAVILGKANLNEFSSARGETPNGWSPRGGQTTGAYVRNQTACGSSSGSGVAASLGLAAAALGTETGGSITCPAFVNNVVGIKPTVGLTSRFGIVPITLRQDTAGPLAQNVADAAVILEAIAGWDPNDNYTSAQPWQVPPEYTSFLNASALHGKRIGAIWIEENLGEAWASLEFNKRFMKSAFDEAIADLRAAGAEVVEISLEMHGIPIENLTTIIHDSSAVYVVPDLKEGLEAYIRDLEPSDNGVRNVTDLVDCIRNDPAEDASEFGLSGIEESAHTNSTSGSVESWEAYQRASTFSRSFIVEALEKHQLDGIVTLMHLAIGLASSSGLPIVTVPMGVLGEDAGTMPDDQRPWLLKSCPGLPLGLSFTADRWSEQDLIGYAYAYEQVSKKRNKLKPYIKPKTDLDSILYNVGDLEL
ncbi:amidase signature domain-containing protein [Xylariales sp. PMI_506]|nr:amidase signature domain-containing protein [Xylariales sp. PMI_506]